MIESKTLHQTIRFGIVGVINTIVGYGVYFILLRFKVFYVASLLISHIIGVTNSYFWNKYFTFKSSQKSFKEVARFVSVYAVTFAVNLVILMVMVEKIKLGKDIAQLIALFVVTAISFLGHKFWSFSQKFQQ